MTWGTQVIGDHDEAAGRHEEVYLVLQGRVDFAVEAETFACTPGTLVVIKDPTVRRSASSASANVAVLVVGNRQGKRFESTWNAKHWLGVPTVNGESFR